MTPRLLDEVWGFEHLLEVVLELHTDFASFLLINTFKKKKKVQKRPKSWPNSPRVHSQEEERSAAERG